MAQPKVLSYLATATGMVEGLSNAKSDTGELAKFYQKYKDVRPTPYFDRVYLPSGMWDSLNVTVSGVLSKQMSVSKANSTLQNDYNKLYNQQN